MDRFEILGILYTAQKQLIGMDDSSRNREAFLETCKELGVQVLSYSPLGLGMLTGKYTSESPPQGPRKKVFEQLQTTPDYNNLLAVMDQVAANHGADATKAQVAINWARAKGSVPIPGARTVRQVQQNYDALNWSLTKEEEQMLGFFFSRSFCEVRVRTYPLGTIRRGFECLLQW